MNDFYYHLSRGDGLDYFRSMKFDPNIINKFFDDRHGETFASNKATLTSRIDHLGALAKA